MSQRPFTKPIPADPLPEIVWLEQTDRSEVGREPFFCGRGAEYEVFHKAVNSLYSGRVGGGTMIFQGAPGAGKTALMLECMEAIRCHSTSDDPWVSVCLNPGTLKSPVDAMMGLIDAANLESERLSKIAPDVIAGNFRKLRDLGSKLYEELSQRGIGVAGVSEGCKPKDGINSDSTMSAGRIFRSATPLLEKFHLVVFVDEAQNIPIDDKTQDVLDCLHRDSQGIPLVAAFFGLSDTQEVLRRCGLSRFAANRVVNLETLSIKDAAGSFRRMLNTYYTGEEEEKLIWANTLAELSQGWPQHINRIGIATGEVLHTNSGQLERYLLEQALERGTERKNDYYAGRLAAVSQNPVLYKNLASAAIRHPQGILSRKELRRLAAPELEETEESFNDFLTNALHAGLLAPVASLPFHYQIPIPSMGDYLRSLPV